MYEKWKLYDRQRTCKAAHQIAAERTEELTLHQKRQDFARQRGIPLSRVNQQVSWDSLLGYLKKLFTEIAASNRDNGKLILSIIGISANKLLTSTEF